MTLKQPCKKKKKQRYNSLSQFLCLCFPPSEARDAARATRLVKSITVKHENVSNMSPEVQHQVQRLSLLFIIILVLASMRPSSWLFSCVTGAAECFGDIWPDGESYRADRRDHGGKAEDPDLNGWVIFLNTVSALTARKNMHWIKCDFVTVKTCKNRFNCAYILKHIFCILYIYQVRLYRSASNKTTELFVLDHLLTFTESLLASPTQDCSRGREPEPETCGRGYCLHGAYWWPADKWASGYFQVTQEE